MDTKYLFKRHNTWWVKVAVPRTLKPILGYDLRESLSTHDLEKAKILREEVVFRLKSRIEKAKNTNQINIDPNKSISNVLHTGVQNFLPPTDLSDPQYYHKVVDCQYACPAHTPVPEYIRQIAQGNYTDAYMINWESNVFPGILGRTCDRTCEPACRRTRTHEKPVAICRLKRVAADFRDDITNLLPKSGKKNGKRIALIGGGPASLTVARDLLILGYECVLFEKDPQAGGLMRTNIPSFRLPEKVLNEEVNLVLDMGVDVRFNTEINSMKALLNEEFDAIFVGTGAPKGRDLSIEGRIEADANVNIGKIIFETS